jgi:hypothetical protein
VSALARAWIAWGRLARRRAFRRGLVDDHEYRRRFVREHAPGRSFADVGCMWNVHGATAFLAEEVGATAVTGFDGMDPTPEFEAERRRRGSRVRFVQGDLHDPASVEDVGAHDVVFCNGVIYHSPSPFLLLERLRALTREHLLVGSHTLPELPGVPQACVLYPGLGDAARSAYGRAHEPGVPGTSAPFDRTPMMGYANMWWGITRSALVSMVELAGFDVVDVHGADPFFTEVVARASEREPSLPPVAFARERGRARASGAA